MHGVLKQIIVFLTLIVFPIIVVAGNTLKRNSKFEGEQISWINLSVPVLLHTGNTNQVRGMAQSTSTYAPVVKTFTLLLFCSLFLRSSGCKTATTRLKTAFTWPKGVDKCYREGEYLDSESRKCIQALSYPCPYFADHL